MPPEYKVVTNDTGESIETAINKASAEGWTYVDTMRVYTYTSYGPHTAYVVLMSRERLGVEH